MHLLRWPIEYLLRVQRDLVSGLGGVDDLYGTDRACNSLESLLVSAT